MNTTNDSESKTETIVHAATIKPKGPRPCYLLLRRREKNILAWFQELGNGQEEATGVEASTVGAAMAQAFRRWKLQGFRPVNCGFRFTLPERDEIGSNALLHEMIASFRSMTGPYFDADVGAMRIVSKPSKEAINLWKRLENENRL